MAELQAALSRLSGASGSSGQGAEAKRALFRKVLQYMTLGIDVSGLMSGMIMCGACADLVIKKMLYLYTANYAELMPEMALLTINTLQKDCSDADPTVRGLALRAFCSLNVPNLIEYVVRAARPPAAGATALSAALPSGETAAVGKRAAHDAPPHGQMTPLKNGLQDRNSYVRRAAVIGTLKVYNIDEEAVRDAELLEMIQTMSVSDQDAQVVANCIVVLREVVGTQALVSKEIVYELLNKIKDFSEWSQCQILDLVNYYLPESQEEMFDIMNVLESRLSHNNCAVVLATAKIFLQITLNFPEVYQQVLERIKMPLITLISGSSYEVSYVVLSHLHLLVKRAPVLFTEDYKSFFCHYNDPAYVKRLKIDMLTEVVDPQNTYEIVNELTEYVTDVDIPIAKESIKAVGKIALKGDALGEIIDRLLQFLGMGIDYVTAEALVQVRNILRRFPERAGDCITAVGGIDANELADEGAKEAFVWILGEYGHVIPDAPYILEPLADGFGDESSALVRLGVLTAAAKLFFVRPAECRLLLGRSLRAAVADDNQDVHDRGLLYFRLLQLNVEEAQRVIAPEKASIAAFAEEGDSSVTDVVFEEFNSLSVIYNKPAIAFIEEYEREDFEDAELEERRANVGGAGGSTAAFTDSNLLSESEQAVVVEEVPPGGDAPVANLLGIDDLLALDVPSAAAAAPPPPPPPALVLAESPQLDPGAFQAAWGSLPIGAEEEVRMAAALPAPEALIRAMLNERVKTMASGGSPAELKFYLFAQRRGAGDNFVLLELVVKNAEGRAVVRVKSADAQACGLMVGVVRGVLAAV